MSMYTAKRFVYTDANGKQRELRPCSLTNREYLGEAISDLLTLSANWPDQTLTFAQLFEASEECRAICKKAVHYAGLKWKHMTLPLLEALFLPNEHGEQGAILKLNFSDSASPEQKAGEALMLKGVSAYEQTIAVLWQLTNDLQQCIQLADQIPAEALVALISARSQLEQMASKDPQEAYKDKAKAELEQMMSDGLIGGAEVNVPIGDS